MEPCTLRQNGFLVNSKSRRVPGGPLSPLKMKSEPGPVIVGQFHYMDMCFKVDHPHQLPNATRPLF
jgi:hypothetical protein